MKLIFLLFYKQFDLNCLVFIENSAFYFLFFWLSNGVEIRAFFWMEFLELFAQQARKTF
jgi:hypothetical protein